MTLLGFHAVPSLFVPEEICNVKLCDESWMEGLELQPCLELDRFMVVFCLVIKLATKMTDRGNST